MIFDDGEKFNISVQIAVFSEEASIQYYEIVGDGRGKDSSFGRG